jgi:hypothetical protein
LRSAATNAANALATVANTITGTVGSSVVDSSYLNLGLQENKTHADAATHGGFTYRVSDTTGWVEYINGLFGDGGSIALTDE